MTTQARLAANRRNAKKSTGPKTEEGKQTTSQNAVRHGLLSANPVFPGEDPAEFALFLQATIADLRPVGAVQKSIAGRIAHLQWKLQRIPHVEAAIMSNLVDEEQDDRESEWIDGDELDRRSRRPLNTAQMIVNDFNDATGVLAKFQLYEQRLERSLRACLKELRDLRKDDAGREEDSAVTLNAATEVADGFVDPHPPQEESATSVAASDASPEPEPVAATELTETNKRTQWVKLRSENGESDGGAVEELLTRSNEEHEVARVESSVSIQETS